MRWLISILTIFFIYSTDLLSNSSNKYTVSKTVHTQLELAKELIKKNKLQKGKEILETLFHDSKIKLNPLEIDLIKYFTAKIYLLQKKETMAISIFDTLLISNLLDQERISDIKIEMAKIYYKSESWRMVIKYLENMGVQNKEVLVMRYDSYMSLREYSRAFDNIILLIDKSEDLKLWEDYLLLSLRLGIDVKNINIKDLAKKLKTFDQVSKFYILFNNYNMKFASAELIEIAISQNITGDYDILIDETIDKFVNLYQYNRARDFINNLRFSHGINIAQKTILFKLNVKLGEFDEATELLSDIKKAGVPQEMYEKELETLININKKQGN